MDNFLNNLRTALLKKNLSEPRVNRIIKSYKALIDEAKRNGKTDEYIIDNMEPISSIVDEFAPNVSYSNNIGRADIDTSAKKSSTAFLFLSIVLLFFVNLISVPITLALFLTAFALLMLPVASTVLGVCLILYNAIYVNGYELALSILTRFGLGIGLIGLSIFGLIIVYYIFKLLIKSTAWYYSLQAQLLRR